MTYAGENPREPEEHELDASSMAQAAAQEAAESWEREVMEPARQAAREAEERDRQARHAHPWAERLSALVFGKYRWHVETDKGRVLGRGRARTIAGVHRAVSRAYERERIRRELRMTTD